MKYDLHLHSTKSDGLNTRLELLRKANENDLSVISFTEHVYIDELNIEELNKEYADQYQEDSRVIVINGIELDVGDYGGMHMLGYALKDIRLLRKRLIELKHKNHIICEAILEEIQKYFGIVINRSDVTKYTVDGFITKRAIIEYLMMNGIVRDVNEAAKKYVGKESACYIKRVEFNTEECIGLIKKAGGISVLAHPSSLNLDDDVFEREIRRLKTLGLDGIEVDNSSKHTPLQVKKYFLLACKYGLIKTSGSDFHRSNRDLFGVENNYSSDFFAHPIIQTELNKQKEYGALT